MVSEKPDTSEIEIRLASVEDASTIASIYGHYVKTSAATFEYIAPDEDEMRHRIATTLKRYPYLVAERNGFVVGFAYAGPLRTRPAYDWSCETSIYIAANERSGGIGRALYEGLEAALSQMGVLSTYACVAHVAREDEFLSDASIRFHKRMGYEAVGRFDNCGNKFGHWYDIVWMKKDLGSHLPDPEPVVPYPLIR